MTSPVVRLRVRSRRTPYRRGGIEFGNLPIVLGPEHFEAGLAGLRAIVAILTDPVLTVKRSALDGEDGDFVAVEQAMIDEMVETLAAIEQAEAVGGDRDAIAAKIEELIGKKAGDLDPSEPPAFDPELAGVGLLTSGGDITKLQSPEGPDANGDDAAAPSPAADGKADGGTDAAPAVEPPPASDASAAPGEQSRAGADASGAAPAAGADAGSQQEDTQQPPIADGTARPEPSSGDAAISADAAPPAPANPQPEKGAAAPVEAKAKAKPRGSSGRQSGRAAAAKKTD